MSFGEGEEQEFPSQEKPFRLSDYKDGTFQPSGHFTPERFLPSEVIDAWEEDNKKFSQGKAWGNGQALFFKGVPLTCGRKPAAVDVVVDKDPIPDGTIMDELAVSRRHFVIYLPEQGTVKIQDLGSTNGVDVFGATGQENTKLSRENPEAELKVGGFVLFGGGKPGDVIQPDGTTIRFPEKWSRIIGFRVCKDSDNKIFLVKFNAKSLDDLLSLIGRTRADSPSLREKPIEDPETADIRNMDIGVTHKVIVDEIDRLKQAMRGGKHGSPEILERNRAIFTSLMDAAKRLGERHYSGDWSLGAAMLGKFALDRSQEALDRGDKKTASASADLAHLAMRLANNQLIQFSKEE